MVLQFVCFALIVFGPRQMIGLPTWPLPWSTLGVILGLVLGGFGVVLMLGGLASLGDNLTPFPRPKADSHLVDSGAYRLVRHPIYSGLIFGAFGWALFRASTLMVVYALILFIFFDIKSRFEELWLADKFAGYASYQTRVRKLIPFVY